MASYSLTHKAVDDLNGIWHYTMVKWSEKQADKYYQMLLDTCQYLADDPSLGRKYEGIRPDLLGLKAIRHIIFYRKIGEDRIEIIRILHGSMDLKNRLQE